MRTRTGSSLLRLLNGQRVLDVLFAAAPEPISRAEIVRRTGLSKPTVSALVADLAYIDVARPTRVLHSPSGPGRPAEPYELVAESGFVIGVDIGATKIIVGVADLLGNIVAEELVDTGAHAQAAAGTIVAVSDRLLKGIKGAAANLGAICVGVPGVYRAKGDSVEMALNLPGFAQLSLRAELESRFGVPVAVDNDVNLAAVAESRARSGDATSSDFTVISVGTGIGMGLVMDGDLYRGANGAAGELGSVPITRLGPSPTGPGGAAGAAATLPGGAAGAAATLEDYASGPAIHKLLQQAIEEGCVSGLDGDVDVPTIFAAAQSGDAAARSALHRAADAMAFAIAHIHWLNDPAAIVFGGGVGANSIFVTAVREHLARYLDDPPSLMVSTLNRRATFLGAIAVAVDELRGSLVADRLGRAQPPPHRQGPPA